MAKYVFSLALIPVQEWIGEARRARDLRAGSAFLCWTMARLLVALQRSAEADIRIPRLLEDLAGLADSPFGRVLDQPYGLPNRAAGYCEAAGDEDLRVKLGALTGVLIQAWEDFRNSGRTDLGGDGRRFLNSLDPWEKAYREKVGDDCPISLVWVAKALAGDADLKRDLEAIDRLFLEVKKTRPVRAWVAGHPIGKCNQCGRREAIGPTGDFPTWRRWHEERAADPWFQRGARIDAGERLCYVCLAKRLASYAGGESFRSTGEVAAGPWLARIPLSARNEFSNALAKAQGADLGRALFLSPSKLAESYGPAVADARRALFAAAANERDLPAHPPSYLALLTFDGDDMGARVRQDPEGVPRSMEEFARMAREEFTRFDRRAEIFYLAGDEGLAMVPAATALDLALALRTRFGMCFGERVTLSAGVALFEQRQPMAGAIRAARAALAEAKERRGKDALGFAVATASGNRFTVVKPWGAEWKRLQKTIELVQHGELASGFAYDAESFLSELPAEAWSRPSVRNAARAEVRRLFFRRVSVDGTTRSERFEQRAELWRQLDGENWWQTDPEKDGPRAAEPFHLVGFLARQLVPSPSGEPA